MKHIEKPILTLLIAAVLLTACQKSEQTDSPATLNSASTVTEYVKQDGDTEVTGEVTAIVGNEVTIALGEAESGASSDNQDGEAPQMPNGEKPDFSNGEVPDFADGEKPDFANGEKPDFADGEMPQKNDDDSDDSSKSGSGRKNKRGSNVKIKSSGETASYIIPVGMTVTGASGRSSDYNAISVGTALKITLNSDGEVVAAEIM